MDLVAGCKEKVASFRIKELKDILTQLGVSKQGKKQDLIDRILTVLSDEQVSKIWTKKKTAGREVVAKLVDDTYRKVRGLGPNDLASKGQSASDSSKVKIKGEVDDRFQSDIKVRCPCGSSSETESMIKCEDQRCRVWQHIRCVIIPEKPMEGSPPVPGIFYCVMCRLTRADPFFVTLEHPLYPVKLTTTIPSDGSNPIQSVERTFQITRAIKDLVVKQEYDVQAWCMLLNDKVQFRMQWPQYADLQVNGVPMRATSRPGSQLLGANGRDDGSIISPCTKDGINKISLTGCDARIFCFGVRIVKLRTVQQVLKLIPKETDGEHFEDALARVCRCVGGGNGADNADSDSDIEVVADFFTVNLRCPMSGSRMKIAGRFKPCAHMGCFDLEVFVELNQRSKKWQCPICLKNYSLENIIIDPYFNRITSTMKDCVEDMTEVEVKPDGSWRVKCKTESERRELRDLAEWHLPDGSLCTSLSDVKQKLQTSMQVKQEGVPESHTGLKLGIRKNTNGLWEFSIPEDISDPSSGNGLREQLGFPGQKVMPISSSATGSGVRDGEDASVNQDGGGTFDFANNGIKLDSICLSLDSPYGFSDRNPSAPKGNAEVIVLSDSDEENDILMSSGPAYNNKENENGVTFMLPASGVPDSYPEDPTIGYNGGTSCLDLYNGNGEEYGMSLWQLPSGTQGGSGFQLFTSDAVVASDVADTLVDMQHGSMICEPSINDYTNGTESAMGSTHLVQDSFGQAGAEMHDGFVDFPFAFGEDDDPSLQIFLPTRPSDELAAPSDLRDQTDVSKGLRIDDWISLRLGDGDGGIHGDSPTANGFETPQQMLSNGLDTSQQMPFGLNTSHQMPSNGLDMSQETRLDGVNTSWQMASDGLNTSQQMPLNGLDSSQQMLSNGVNTTRQMASNGLNTSQPMATREASSLLGTNDRSFEKSSRQRTDGPFSFPRRKRTRVRLHLSIDSGSE